MLESTLGAIQNSYYNIYITISDTEWAEINSTIYTHFREYDRKIDKDTTIPNVLKSIRRVLPPPAAPILIESDDEEDESGYSV